MTFRPRCQLSAAITAGALLVGACGGSEPTGLPGPGTPNTQLRITALVVGTPIDLMVARVTAADIAVPLVFNLPVTDGVATGTLRIPPGPARTITLEAFDALGNVTHEGSVTLDVHPGANPPVNIAMLPRSGDIPVTATLAEFSVLVSPASAALPAGETLQFSAQILDADDNPLAGAVAWAVTNPAFARINQAGLATGVAPGALSIVATFGGVAGLAQLEITQGATGGIHGTVTSPQIGPLAGVEVAVSYLGPGKLTQTAVDGTYQFTGLPEGGAVVSIASGLPAGCDEPPQTGAVVVAGESVPVDFSVTCSLGGGAVIITEVMAWPIGMPEGFEVRGEWVELHNRTGAPVDISGWHIVLEQPGNVSEWCTVQSGVIQPGAHAVVGPVTDPAFNGGVSNVIACDPVGGSGLPNGSPFLLRLELPSFEVVDLTAPFMATQGVSVSLSLSAYDPVGNDDPAAWCQGTAPYGTTGNLGTPGQLNPICGASGFRVGSR